MKDLIDTVELMASDDYKQRFKAEYYQTEIRYEANVVDFEPKCSIDILKKQASYMGDYLYMLEVRAEIEGIEL